MSNAATQAEDVTPMVLTARGVRPSGMKGQVLTDALVQAAPITQQARIDEVAQIEIVASALSAQDLRPRAGGRDLKT